MLKVFYKLKIDTIRETICHTRFIQNETSGLLSIKALNEDVIEGLIFIVAQTLDCKR